MDRLKEMCEPLKKIGAYMESSKPRKTKGRKRCADGRRVWLGRLKGGTSYTTTALSAYLQIIGFTIF